MANQNSYKRTVAGSVGAGMGAIFNGSGRTYYILEHKTDTKFHSAGESQKIIIDQIELGRGSSCQVRFDESLETVSRKHAAIVRDGDNWLLIHLSSSNPTLVNGNPVQGQYYLQSGDEIQLSVGGPKMGFIVPQGKQALTSSIKLTERMNLFRQQALAPYKRAILALSVLLILVILGFGCWNYMLHQQLQDQKEEAVALKAQAANLNKQITELELVADKTPELQNQLDELKKQRANVITNYRTIIKEVEKQDPNAVKEIEEKDDVVIPEEEENKEVAEEDATASDAKTDLREYYPHIYRIIVEDIVLQFGGIERSAGMNTDNIDCGTGFILSNGTFVTARQNVQPWLYVGGIEPSGWRAEIAKYVAMGFDIKMKFTAYSTSGPSKKFEISSRDFDVPESGDVVTATIPISKADWKYVQGLGFTISKKDMKRVGTNIQYTTSRGRSYALYRNTGRDGIPTNNGAAQTLSGAHDIEICGYTSNDVQSLASSVNYHKTSTSTADTKNGTIHIQATPSSNGYLGAPAFIKEDDGTYRIVGVYVGNSQVVPINKCQ